MAQRNKVMSEIAALLKKAKDFERTAEKCEDQYKEILKKATAFEKKDDSEMAQQYATLAQSKRELRMQYAKAQLNIIKLCDKMKMEIEIQGMNTDFSRMTKDIASILNCSDIKTMNQKMAQFEMVTTKLEEVSNRTTTMIESKSSTDQEKATLLYSQIKDSVDFDESKYIPPNTSVEKNASTNTNTEFNAS